MLNSVREERKSPDKIHRRTPHNVRNHRKRIRLGRRNIPRERLHDNPGGRLRLHRDRLRARTLRRFGEAPALQHGDSYPRGNAPGRKPREPQAQTFPAHTLRGTALRVLHGYRSEAQGRTAPHELERRPRRARPLQDNRPQLEGQERRGYAVQRYQEIL